MTQAVAESILVHACLYSGVSIAEVRGHVRQRHIARVRHCIMYAVRERTEWSLPQIAKFVGLSDHSSVIHGVRLIEGSLSKDPEMAAFVEHLMGTPAISPGFADAQMQLARSGKPMVGVGGMVAPPVPQQPIAVIKPRVESVPRAVLAPSGPARPQRRGDAFKRRFRIDGQWIDIEIEGKTKAEVRAAKMVAQGSSKLARALRVADVAISTFESTLTPIPPHPSMLPTAGGKAVVRRKAAPPPKPAIVPVSPPPEAPPAPPPVAVPVATPKPTKRVLTPAEPAPVNRRKALAFHPNVTERAWCDQCDRLVAKPNVDACKIRFCPIMRP